jgi:hypothetical protein
MHKRLNDRKGAKAQRVQILNTSFLCVFAVNKYVGDR